MQSATCALLKGRGGGGVEEEGDCSFRKKTLGKTLSMISEGVKTVMVEFLSNQVLKTRPAYFVFVCFKLGQPRAWTLPA